MTEARRSEDPQRASGEGALGRDQHDHLVGVAAAIRTRHAEGKRSQAGTAKGGLHVRRVPVGPKRHGYNSKDE